MEKGAIAILSLALVTTAYGWKAANDKVKNTTIKLVSNGAKLLLSGYKEKNSEKISLGIFELEVVYTQKKSETEKMFKSIVSDLGTLDKLNLHYALEEFNKHTKYPLATTLNIWVWETLSKTDPFPELDLTIDCSDTSDQKYRDDIKLVKSLFIHYGIKGLKQ